jgi:hypothetical protein
MCDNWNLKITIQNGCWWWGTWIEGDGIWKKCWAIVLWEGRKEVIATKVECLDAKLQKGPINYDSNVEGEHE